MQFFSPYIIVFYSNLSKSKCRLKFAITDIIMSIDNLNL